MREDIRERVELIKRGEVPEGYKKKQGMVFPVSWNIVKMKDLFERVDRKNKEGNTNVLTISAQEGLICQEDFFNKLVAGEDKTNYYLVYKGEFAYNKSYSKGYPYGAIKRLDFYEKGIVSPLYICFKTISDEYSNDYFVHYFEGGMLNREIHAFAQEGARNHGLLNISMVDFFNSNICVPQHDEQQEIAKIINLYEKKIQLQRALILEKKRLKKWQVKVLLTGKKTIPGFESEYKKIKLGELLSEVKEKKGSEEIQICSVAVQKGIINQEEHLGRRYAADDTSQYHVVSYGDLVYTKSPTGEFPYGIIKQSFLKEKVAVSPLYGVFKAKTFEIGFLLYSYFQDKNNVYNYLHSIIQKGAKNTINITNDTFLSKEVMIPTDSVAQKKISEILMTADKEIELLEKQLEQIKLEKKAVMQLLLTGIVRVR